MAGTTAWAGVSRLSLPRSTHCTAATEVMALVIEAIQPTVSMVIACPPPSTRSPKAPS